MSKEFEEEFFFELRYKPDIIKTKIFDKVFIDNNKDKIKIIYKKKKNMVYKNILRILILILIVKI